MYFNVGTTLANGILLREIEFEESRVMEKERIDKYRPH